MGSLVMIGQTNRQTDKQQLEKHVVYLQVLELSCSVPGGPLLKNIYKLNGVFVKKELGVCHKLGFDNP